MGLLQLLVFCSTGCGRPQDREQVSTVAPVFLCTSLKSKHMKKTFLFLVISFLTISVFAQKGRDIVYLKNGSIIRGTVIEHVINESIKIQTSDGSLFVYPDSELLKVVKEDLNSISRDNRAADNYYKSEYPTKGYRWFLDLATSYAPNEEVYRYSLSTSHGYQFNKFYLGGGLGYQVLFNPELKRNNTVNTLLGFVDVRWDFASSKCSPFLGLRVGDMINLDSDKFEGYFYYKVSLGARINMVSVYGIYESNAGVEGQFFGHSYGLGVSFDFGGRN